MRARYNRDAMTAPAATQPPRYAKGDTVYTVGRERGGELCVVPWEVRECAPEGDLRESSVRCISRAPGSDVYSTIIPNPLTFESAKAIVLKAARLAFERVISTRPYDPATARLGEAPTKTLVVVESPFAPAQGHAGLTDAEYHAEIDENLAYARRCCHDSLARNEAPFASHLFLTQPGILDDREPAERTLGIESGLAWGSRADVTAVYIDRGISGGMRQGIERARVDGRRIVWRSLVSGQQWDSDPQVSRSSVQEDVR